MRGYYMVLMRCFSLPLRFDFDETPARVITGVWIFVELEMRRKYKQRIDYEIEVAVSSLPNAHFHASFFSGE